MRYLSLLCLCIFVTCPVSGAQTVIAKSASSIQDAIADSISEARRQKKGSYSVRTRHLNAGEPVYINRLILEDSPYLLQHAHNPVNWYAWGDEAFAAARKQNKPVFLSIGYSTCHWCHVMEDESFDDEAVAEILNRNFISIKVDRELRPDLDEIYMTGVQIMTGSGGWPMSSFLTADSKPFYAGTYYPRDQFIQLLQRIHTAWLDNSAALSINAEHIYAAIEQQLVSYGKAASIGQQQIEAALAHILATQDHQYGGQAGAPKFPNETSLLLLLERVERSDQPLNNNPYWQTLYRALDGMMRGGIYDQIAGGFHRYTIDSQWLRPHFEKMLYNQAQLSRLYARAWKLSGNTEFRRIAQETLDYVLREMHSKEGAFYSATDADSEGEEGKYFVWSHQELKQQLNARQLALVEKVYGVTWEGNFESTNLLYLPRPLEQVAIDLKLNRTDLQQQLTIIKKELLQVRQSRISPLRDNKIITAWNSLMITALVESGYLLNEPRYITAAFQAAEFIWQHNRDNNGLLYRIHLNGRSGTQATLEDYSFYLQAILALYDTSGDQAWLRKATLLQQQMTDLFWNNIQGGFYISQASTTGPMLLRSQSASDGAIPSGNSVALVAMVALNQRANSFTLQNQIDKQIVRYSSHLTRAPYDLSVMLTGIDEYQHPKPTFVQYAGAGHVRMIATLLKSNSDIPQLNVELKIDNGWHINANDIGIEKLIPTELTMNNSLPKSIQYPEAIIKRLGFTDTPLKLYEDNVIIVAQLPGNLNHTTDAKPHIATLILQACNDKVCLPPESLRIVIRN